MSINSALGKVAELEFNLTALKRGYACLWPSLDIHGYDCVIDSDSKLYKIQIKSSSGLKNRVRSYPSVGFSLSTGKGGKKRYDRSEVDFFALFWHDERKWFIIPFEEVTNLSQVSIYPGRKSKYNKFENAWHLFD